MCVLICNHLKQVPPYYITVLPIAELLALQKMALSIFILI